PLLPCQYYAGCKGKRVAQSCWIIAGDPTFLFSLYAHAFVTGMRDVRRQMRLPIRIVLTGIVVFLAAEVSARAQSITRFDGPGSTFTQGLSINNAGAVTGAYFAGGTFHGFIRDARGTFTSFDVPGSTSTAAQSINNAGAVTGFYSVRDITHGFIRDARGTFTTVDPPGATLTIASSINEASAVTGHYEDGVGFHGFIRDARGTFISFYVLGATDTVP